MATSTALSLSKYVIERDLSSMLSLSLDFKDDSGATVLLTKGKVLVTRQSIEEPNGNVLVTITHKLLSLTPTYEIHEGGFDGQVSAIIKQTFSLESLIGGKSISIEDASGQEIAIAKGDFTGFEFNVSASDGTQVATVSKSLGPGMMQAVTDLMKRKYVLNISNAEKVPVLSILGFLVVLEIMASQNQNRNTGVGLGGLGALGGLGGGGIIKL